jgi:hypothetical protein
VKIRRTTAISIQTDEAFIVRRGRGGVEVLCRQCIAAVMIPPEEAAALLQLPVRRIYRLIEAGQLHFQETTAGSVLVCLESLRKMAPLLPPKQGPKINSTHSKENQS